MTAHDVQHALEEVSSPEKAKSSAWFFKTGEGEYGAGDHFIGVTVPDQRKVAKKFKDLPLPELKKLLKSPVHEARLTALFILVDQFEHADEANRHVIAGFYMQELDRVNNWDLVDSSAPQILGSWLMSIEDTKLLDNLAQSKNIWHRRVAIIATQAFIRADMFDDTLRIASMLVDDKHDLIQKAVGWMLREVGNRDQAVEEQFLKQHAATMPRTMLRYATEKFPEALRKQYLAAKSESKDLS